MGPPSSFLFALVAIVVLAFAILSFISAVNYKNVANNDTEGESLGKGTANSLSTTMIIFGIIFVIVFFYFVYVIYNYDNKDLKIIDPRDSSLLRRANESIFKFESVKNAYNGLQEKFRKLKKEKMEIEAGSKEWNACPEPLIKLSLQGSGEIKEAKYNNQGKIESLIIKPAPIKDEKDNTKTIGYQQLKFQMETQPCYKLDDNTGSSGSGLFGRKYGPMSQQISFGNTVQNPHNYAPGSRTNVLNPVFNISDISQQRSFGDNCKGLLTNQKVTVPAVCVKGACDKPQQENPFQSRFSGSQFLPQLGGLGVN